MGSRGHVTKPLTNILVAKGVDTTVITRSKENAKLIEKDGAKAVIGSNFDKKFMLDSFMGADFVFILLPVNIFVADTLQQLKDQCSIACDAILEAGVPNVIYFSGIGSDNPDLGFHYDAENIVKEKLGSLNSITIVRAAAFFTNLLNHVNTIKSNGVIYSNTQRDQVETYVHADDIAQVCVDIIMNPSLDKKITIVSVESDSANASQIEQLFKDNLGLDVKWVSVSDEDALQSLTNAGVAEANSKAFINLFSEKYHKDIVDGVNAHRNIVGVHRLPEFLKTEFASVYNQ